jgi:hypothetical protein
LRSGGGEVCTNGFGDPSVIFGRSVAAQVAFERQTLKPAFHLIGYRLWV